MKTNIKLTKPAEGGRRNQWKADKVARTIKLDPKVGITIISLLKFGHHRNAIEQSLQLKEGQISRWLDTGMASKNHSMMYRFAAEVVLAELEPETKALELLFAKMDKQPNLITWFLERRYRDRWGKYDVETIELEKEKARAEIAKLKAEAEAMLSGGSKDGDITFEIPDYSNHAENKITAEEIKKEIEKN